jgi:serine/threonine protein kinase
MRPEDYQRAVEVCLGAWELAPETRNAFLSAACEGDDSLRQQVEALLDADRRADSFLREPPYCLVSAALASIPSPCSPGERLGEYQILSRLGGGGMAEVFLAEDLLLDRKVALKVLPGELTAHFAWLQQLQEEARAASRLNHPNILTVFGFGNAAGVHYLATELVEGPTLRQMLDGGALPLSTAIDIAIQIASALEAAHEAGVVHRDIKPENLVRRLDGLVKVLDFGVAERVGQNDHPTKVITGTPQYMSPEQAAGHVTDARTDLFSLGLVLYEMLTGHPAFRGASVTGTMEQVLSRDPPPLGLSGSSCPRALACIVTNLLEKDREKRLQTARQLRVELEAVRKRLKRVWTRSRLAIAASVVLLLVAGLQTYHLIRTAPTVAIRSLAVLPLEDLSTDRDRAYVSEGITEQTIAALSRLKGLRVISLASVMRFSQSREPLNEIAREIKHGRIAYRLSRGWQQACANHSEVDPCKTTAATMGGELRAQPWGHAFVSAGNSNKDCWQRPERRPA